MNKSGIVVFLFYAALFFILNPPCVVAETAADDIPRMGEKDRALLLKGVWWDMYPPILPDAGEMEKIRNEVRHVPFSLVDEQPIVDIIPEDDKKIHEQYLPEYIRQAEKGLIDPQLLLNEVHHEDAVGLISALEAYSSIKIYVSIFSKEQEVPPEVNAPALARQIFKEGERSVLLHVHYGQIARLQIICDAKWMEQMGDKARRSLVSKVKEAASVYTYPQDSMMEAIAATIVYLEPDANELSGAVKKEQEQSRDHVPAVDVELVEPEVVKKSGLSDMIKKLAGEAQGYFAYAIWGVIGLVMIAIIIYWKRYVTPVHLTPIEVDKRLGAPYGAGVSTAVNYGGREDSDPQSLYRRQMRDHLKDIT